MNSGHEELTTFKVILVGDEGVGKSSIFRRLKDGVFQEGTVSTLGVDYYPATRRLPETGTTVRLQLWDTGGAERFRRLTKSYYRDAHAVVFVFSLDKVASLHSLAAWITEARECGPARAQYFFVCNKTDLPDDDIVIYDHMIASFFASPMQGAENSKPFRVSAKDDIGIQESIDAVLGKLYSSFASDSREAELAGDTIKLENNPLNQSVEQRSTFDKCCR